MLNRKPALRGVYTREQFRPADLSHSFSSSHSFVVSLKTVPAGQTHWKLPAVFLHWPFRQTVASLHSSSSRHFLPLLSTV
jgi:hypothetical protein